MTTCPSGVSRSITGFHGRQADDPGYPPRGAVTAPHPIQYVKGVGPRLGEKLAARGIRTPHDALYFFPRDYEDRRKVVPIRELKAGTTAPVRGKILSVQGGGNILRLARLTDYTVALNGPFEIIITNVSGLALGSAPMGWV
ncbi:MAG: hypothetical protein B7Z74_05755 [Deltaproteobacteria bacterium 21-66-5]|nr:MAG: hypothetical protein B7Z74_05755 [Deltaproteobacteria bacterium 21-66-5]